MLALPLTPEACLDAIVRPALSRELARMDTPRAWVMLLAIGLQESQLAARVQVRGPARGLWQFEVVGVRGVLTHPASKPDAMRIAQARVGATDAATVQAALGTDDALACCIARLLLYTLPQRLPALGDADGAWRQYASAWRPGIPRPLTWPRNYQHALEAIQ